MTLLNEWIIESGTGLIDAGSTKGRENTYSSILHYRQVAVEEATVSTRPTDKPKQRGYTLSRQGPSASYNSLGIGTPGFCDGKPRHDGSVGGRFIGIDGVLGTSVDALQVSVIKLDTMLCPVYSQDLT